MFKKIIGLTVLIVIIICSQTWATNTLIQYIEAKEVLPLDSEGCLVLNYHIIKKESFIKETLDAQSENYDPNQYTVSKDEFEKQMLYLKEHHVLFITPEELYAYTTGKKDFPAQKAVLITFDDVDESVYNNAFSFLKEQHIPSLMFIITGQVGNKDYHDLRLLDWKQINDMQQSGIVSFGTHTDNLHYKDEDSATPFSKERNEELFKKDTDQSIATFQSHFGAKPKYFAYPYGFGTPSTDQILLNKGFTMLFSLREGTVKKNDHSFFMKRFLVTDQSWKQVQKWIEEPKDLT